MDRVGRMIWGCWRRQVARPGILEANSAITALFTVTRSPSVAAGRSVGRRGDDVAKSLPEEGVIDGLSAIGRRPVKFIIGEQEVQQLASAQPVPLSEGTTDAIEQRNQAAFGLVGGKSLSGRFTY